MHPKIFQRALLTAVLWTAAFLFPALGQDPAPSDTKQVVTPSGLKYIDLKVGQGEAAAIGKIVEVQYTGWLENGIRFDTSRERRPFTFRLGAGDGIKGWDEGLVGMKVGGKRQLVIPPELGFGKQGVGSVVPPNSVLYYEFELLEVREDSGRSR
jgi:FKBP-type peptidyl-prolyl cis-trans isomerase FkpA